MADQEGSAPTEQKTEVPTEESEKQEAVAEVSEKAEESAPEVQEGKF